MSQIKREPYVKSLPLINQGKVRDLYDLPRFPSYMLMVATDGISTNNIVHRSSIPLKGQVLTAMSVFSSENILEETPDHLVAFGKRIYDYLPKFEEYPSDLHLRALVVRKTKVIPVEFIHRAYMAGSLFKTYSKGEPNPYHLDLPKGFRLMSKFDEPIFTPTEKSEKDLPLDTRTVGFLLPEATRLSELVYNLGRKHALGCDGIEIIDFKCEVGTTPSGELLLIDEWLNGDCCRFVEEKSIQEGIEPEWMDKQIARNYIGGKWKEEGKGKHPLVLPDDVIHETADAYHELFERWTGKTLSGFQKYDL